MFSSPAADPTDPTAVGVHIRPPTCGFGRNYPLRLNFSEVGALAWNLLVFFRYRGGTDETAPLFVSNAVFVGEASSECCALHGDPTEVFLPYSKVKGELTAVNWNLGEAFDGRREISPDLPVQLSAAAYFAGQDPVLEQVFSAIRNDANPRN